MKPVHWDDVAGFDVPHELEPLGGHWQRLGDAAGTVRVGVQRVRLAPGQLLTPPHAHTAEEEIFHVLSGAATLWQDGETWVVVPGDTIVHVPGGPAHTLLGGDEGLDVLVFGQRLTPEGGVLPRTRVAWLADSGVAVLAESPWVAEAALGLPEGLPGEQPANVVALADVEGDYGGAWKRVGAAAGATQTGLNWAVLSPNDEGAAPHCHTAEEEVFVVLDGEGTLELWGPPKPDAPLPTEPAETFPLRRGHVVARLPGTRVSHCLRAAADGMTYLAYGTKDPNDICYYPRSNKIYFRGLGLLARLEPLEYSDGEPS